MPQEQVTIPAVGKREVVESGKAKGFPEADSIEKNIQKGLLKVRREKSSSHIGRDQALVKIPERGRYDMVAIDDAKLIRFLGSMNMPSTVPNLLFYSLFRKETIGPEVVLHWLDRLSPFISSEEYSSVRLLLEARK